MTLEAGKTYRFDQEGSLFGAGDLDLRSPNLHGIYNAQGDKLAHTTIADFQTHHFSWFYFTATDTATYFVSAGSHGKSVGTYRVWAWDVTDDFTADTDTAGRVAVGGSAVGELEVPGDHDWFAVELTAGRTYRFDAEGAWVGAGSLEYPLLDGVYDDDGEPLNGTVLDDDFFNAHGAMTFTPTTDGTYYVSIGANFTFSNPRYLGHRTEALGTYRLSVTDVTSDVSAGTDTTGTVEVGGIARGEIEVAGDIDWFAVTLEAGRTYLFYLDGVVGSYAGSTGFGTLEDPYLRGIYDAESNLIPGTTNTNSDFFSAGTKFTATASATHYVSVSAGDRDGGLGTGTYRLAVRDVTDDYTAGTDTAGVVAVGGMVEGEIEEVSDRDWFKVALEAGKTYHIDLDGLDSGSGTLWNPYLHGVYDADGDLIAGTTDNNGGWGWYNSRVTFTATESATHYVSAGTGDSFNSGGFPYAPVQYRHLHAVGDGRDRNCGRYQHHGRDCGRQFEGGHCQIGGRRGLVCGRAGGGQDLPVRSQGCAERRRHPARPVPARHPRLRGHPDPRHDERRRRHGRQQPGGVHGDGQRPER